MLRANTNGHIWRKGARAKEGKTEGRKELLCSRVTHSLSTSFYHFSVSLSPFSSADKCSSSPSEEDGTLQGEEWRSLFFVVFGACRVMDESLTHKLLEIMMLKHTI